MCFYTSYELTDKQDTIRSIKIVSVCIYYLRIIIFPVPLSRHRIYVTIPATNIALSIQENRVFSFEK
jgi:hypothetical protein